MVVKKGQVLNPNGRPKKPKEVKAMQKLRQNEFERLIHKFFYMTAEEVQQQIKKPHTPMIEIFIGQIMILGVKKGDPIRLEYLAQRIFGKNYSVMPMLDMMEEKESAGKESFKIEFIEAKKDAL